MKFVATQPFNAYGVIAKGEGHEVEIHDETVAVNLENIGFIKKAERMETEVESKAKSQTKRSKK